MVQTVERAKGVIEIRPEEIEDFDLQVKRFQAGEWDETEFQAFRLKQGIYGQRQPDAQMVRVKVPFGGLTAEQMDALGEVSARFAPLNKGHVTTRENVQIHHVRLEDTPELMRLLGTAGLTTREACGNTVRNVTGCPMAGVCADEPFDVTPYAAAYARYFVRHPYTQGLPRKFKTAFSGCARDCAITAIHDMGFIPKVEGGQRGFQVLTGGGTSIMPKLAPTLYDFVPEDEYLKVTEAVIRVFHRTDELRKNRMKARIKFYIARIGIDAFREQIDEELKEEWAQRSFDPTPLLFLEDESLDAPIAPAAGYHTNGHHADFQRWTESNVHLQKQTGYRVVTAKLPLGDINAEQWHELADLSRKYAGGRSRITHQQNIAFRWVPDTALYEVWEELGRIGFGGSGAHEITDVVSCPGTDSCKLGITASMGLGRAVEETVGAARPVGPAAAEDAREDERLPQRMRAAPRRRHRLPRRRLQGAGGTGARLRAVRRRQLRRWGRTDGAAGQDQGAREARTRSRQDDHWLLPGEPQRWGAVQGLRRQGRREVLRASVAGPERDRRAEQGYPGHVH